MPLSVLVSTRGIVARVFCVVAAQACMRVCTEDEEEGKVKGNRVFNEWFPFSHCC